MLSRFQGPKSRATLAVKFDGHVDQLINFAQNWRAKSNCELHLTHVEEAWEGIPWLMSLDHADMPKEMLAQAIDRDRELLEHRLFELAKEAGGAEKPLSHNTLYTHDSIGQAIISDALSHKSSVIICGYDSSATPSSRVGKATAINLAWKSPIPVLVTPLKKGSWLKQEHPNVVICDDFTEGSAWAVQSGFEAAETIGAKQVYHLHVARLDHGDFEGQTHAIVESLVTDMKKRGQDASGVFLLKKLMDRLEQDMQDRSATHQLLLAEKAIAYKPELRYGNPLQEIRRLADQVNADLVVLGRHEDFHHEPFAVGRVPMELMLSLERPILVVPVQKKVGTRVMG